MGADGPGLSCPGSSVVAESGRGYKILRGCVDLAERWSLIKSPVETLPQDTQQEESSEKAGAFELLTKDSAVDTLYAMIQRAVAAVQPVLILEETSSSGVEQSDKPAPTEPLSMKEPQI